MTGRRSIHLCWPPHTQHTCLKLHPSRVQPQLWLWNRHVPETLADPSFFNFCHSSLGTLSPLTSVLSFSFLSFVVFSVLAFFLSLPFLPGLTLLSGLFDDAGVWTVTSLCAASLGTLPSCPAWPQSSRSRGGPKPRRAPRNMFQILTASRP